MFELLEGQEDGREEVLGLCPCICVGPPVARQAIKWSLKAVVRASIPDPDEKK